MKILHTSDWHLGHTLYGYDRTPEFRHFFRQLADIAASHQPDALIVSGDVFHYSAPSVEAQNLLVEALFDLRAAAPQMSVFIIGGNHDSGSRLEVSSPLWNMHDVHIVGRIHLIEDKKDADGNADCEKAGEDKADPSRHIFLLPGRGVVVCLPYFYARHFDTASLFSSVLGEAQKMAAGQQGAALPVVVSAHLAVAESLNFTSDDAIGNIDYVDINTLGSGYDYLALGHIHRPRSFSGGRARYCGTPVSVSFDEDHPHGVDLVEIVAGATPVVTTLPIRPLRALVTLPQEPQPLPDVLEAVGSLPADFDAYLRLHVLVDDYLPADAQLRVSELLEGRQCRFCLIKTQLRGQDTEVEQALHAMNVSDFQELNPSDVAMQLYLQRNHIPMSPDLQELLLQAIESVNVNTSSIS